MSASNTKDCVRDQIGKRIVGVLFDALPLSDRRLAAGNKTFVFEDGSGFTFSSSGSFWEERADDIKRAVNRQRERLEANQRDLQDVLDLAGDPS